MSSPSRAAAVPDVEPVAPFRDLEVLPAGLEEAFVSLVRDEEGEEG